METKAVSSADEDSALETLRILNHIIGLSAERLEGLRTQCATNAEITHQEIRTLEGKLIKMFCDQLGAKKQITPQKLPDGFQNRTLKLWLQVVGLSPKTSEGICHRIESLENLKDHSDHDILLLMKENNSSDIETMKLTRALQNLKRYTDLRRKQSDNGKEPSQSNTSSGNDLNDFYWDSWDMSKVQSEPVSSAISSPPMGRRARSSVPSEECLRDGSNTHSCSTTPCTPVTTVAPSPAFSHPNIYSPTPSVFSQSSTSPQSHVYDANSTPPATPPMKEKNTNSPTPSGKKLSNNSQTNATNLQPENFPLTKSKSHESQLGSRVDCSDTNLVSLEKLPTKRRERLPTEPGPQPPTSTWDPSLSSVSGVSVQSASVTVASVSGSISSVGSPMTGYASPLAASPIKSPPISQSQTEVPDDLEPHKNSLHVPKSPRTPTLGRSMGHMISHRFTKMIKVTNCDYCLKQILIGLRCKDCKFKCHKDCEPKVPASCGLPSELVDVFAQHLKKEGEIVVPRFTNTSPNPNWRRDRKKTRPPMIPPFPGPDSSSNTSSCNSSTPSSPFYATSSTTSCPNNHSFHFPDVEREVTLETRPLNELTSTEKSNDSDRTISQTSGSGSTDSEKTLALRVDSQDSQISDGELVERSWPRQNSLSNKEWDIPFDELKIGDKIGTGHFGTVYRGNWHGDVAIKLLDMAYLDNEKTLEQFKQEVAIFRKTRHENLVLFMGACMKPPRLAIVTSYCKGLSLYTRLHLQKDKFTMTSIAAMAAQITQGMGYLHARGIIHKDLKSKNIFITEIGTGSGVGKVVITDFGLFSVTKLCQGNRDGDSLSIPQGWLCYLAPEIMKSLRPVSKYDSELPFTKASDAYAFGTIWYELLTNEWPYKELPPEAIIWQVGSGIRQPLPTLFSRDVKEILMSCWSGRPEDRLDFARIQKIVEKLPKKRLARSPSHPVGLSRHSRSAESVV